MKFGLTVNRRTVNQLGWGRKRKNSRFDYVAPDFMLADYEPHNSMTMAWLHAGIPAEERTSTRNGRRAESKFGFYIPDREPRLIPEGAFLHESAVEKIKRDPRLQDRTTSRRITAPSRCRPPQSSRWGMPRGRMRCSARREPVA